MNKGMPILPQGGWSAGKAKAKLRPSHTEQLNYDKAYSSRAAGAKSKEIDFQIRRFEELYPDLATDLGWAANLAI